MKDVNRDRLKAAGYYTAKVVAKNKERAIHGEARRSGKTRTYRIWQNLAHRHYESGPVCDRWNDYRLFLEDMGPCPSTDHSIDRIKNHRGYEPGNCRWATMKEQQNNRTNNRHITFKGVAMTLAQWSDKTGIPNNTIAARIDRLGWTIEEALELD